jgi:hypothetical protein
MGAFFYFNCCCWFELLNFAINGKRQRATTYYYVLSVEYLTHFLDSVVKVGILRNIPKGFFISLH